MFRIDNFEKCCQICYILLNFDPERKNMQKKNKKTKRWSTLSLGEQLSGEDQQAAPEVQVYPEGRVVQNSLLDQKLDRGLAASLETERGYPPVRWTRFDWVWEEEIWISFPL